MHKSLLEPGMSPFKTKQKLDSLNTGHSFGNESALDFRHEPFDDPGTEVRLLRLCPNSGGDNLHLQLTHHTLAELPQFVAISYTWGDVLEERVVYLDNHPMRVRRNCHSTLRRVMQKYPQHLLWIDSICIDQSDIQEKSVQVGLMGEIYAKAMFVVACIEAGNQTSQQLLQLWPSAADIAMAQSREHPNAYDDWVASCSHDYLVRFRQSVFTFINRPYWTRVWIKQELALAQGVRILYGNQELTWSDIEIIRNFFLAATLVHTLRRDHFSMFGTDSPERQAARVMSTISGILGSKSHSLKIGHALEISVLSHCEDPRDRIYGTSSLARWSLPSLPFLEIDYNVSTFQLALRAIPYIEWLNSLDNLIQALQITFNMPEVEELVRQRRNSTCSPDTAYLNSPPQRSTTAVILKGPSRLCPLELDDEGRLTAHLVHNSTTKERPDFFNNVPLTMEDLKSISEDDVFATQPQAVYVGSEIAALVCRDARAGDFLMDLGLRSGVTSDGQILGAVRFTGGKNYSVIGQGVCMGHFHICPCMVSCPQRDTYSFSAHITVNTTAENALALVAQDFVSSNKYDLASRYGRLRTRLTEHSAEMPFLIHKFSRSYGSHFRDFHSFEEVLDFNRRRRPE